MICSNDYLYNHMNEKQKTPSSELAERLVIDYSLYIGLVIAEGDRLLLDLHVSEYYQLVKGVHLEYSKYFTKVFKQLIKKGVTAHLHPIVGEHIRVLLGLVRVFHPELIGDLQGVFDISEKKLLDDYKRRSQQNLKGLSEVKNKNIARWLLSSRSSTTLELNYEEFRIFGELLTSNSIFWLQGLLTLSHRLRISKGVPLWQSLKSITLTKTDVVGLLKNHIRSAYPGGGDLFFELFQNSLNSEKQSDLVRHILNCELLVVDTGIDTTGIIEYSRLEVLVQEDMRNIRKQFIRYRINQRLSSTQILHYSVVFENQDSGYSEKLVQELISVNSMVVEPTQTQTTHKVLHCTIGEQKLEIRILPL